LFPLASPLNKDPIHLQGQRLGNMPGQLANHVDTATAPLGPLFPLASLAGRTSRCAGRSTMKRCESLCVIMLFEPQHNPLRTPTPLVTSVLSKPKWFVPEAVTRSTSP
jgi:hypothetical protein